MIPAHLLLFGGPLIVAVIVYLLRRSTLVASLLSAAAALAVAWVANTSPLTADKSILGGWIKGGEHLIFGRPFFLSPSDQVVLTIPGLTAAGLFLLAARLRPDDFFLLDLLVTLGKVQSSKRKEHQGGSNRGSSDR